MFVALADVDDIREHMPGFLEVWMHDGKDVHCTLWVCCLREIGSRQLPSYMIVLPLLHLHRLLSTGSRFTRCRLENHQMSLHLEDRPRAGYVLLLQIAIVTCRNGMNYYFV